MSDEAPQDQKQQQRRPPRTDQHTITVDKVSEERHGVACVGWTASCICGWQSRVFTEYEELAIEAARKHSDWVEYRPMRRPVNVHIRINANEIPTADAVKELVKAAERGST